MDPLKIGLVGYGFGGRYFHAPLIASAAECEFVGVVTTSEERRALLRTEHPVSTPSTRWPRWPPRAPRP